MHKLIPVTFVYRYIEYQFSRPHRQVYVNIIDRQMAFHVENLYRIDFKLCIHSTAVAIKLKTLFE